MAQVWTQNLALLFKPHCHSVSVILLPACLWWLVISPVWRGARGPTHIQIGKRLSVPMALILLIGCKGKCHHFRNALWVEFIEETSSVSSKRKASVPDFFHQQHCSFSHTKQVCYYSMKDLLAPWWDFICDKWCICSLYLSLPVSLHLLRIFTSEPKLLVVSVWWDDSQKGNEAVSLSFWFGCGCVRIMASQSILLMAKWRLTWKSVPNRSSCLCPGL